MVKHPTTEGAGSGAGGGSGTGGARESFTKLITATKKAAHRNNVVLLEACANGKLLYFFCSHAGTPRETPSRIPPLPCSTLLHSLQMEGGGLKPNNPARTQP